MPYLQNARAIGIGIAGQVDNGVLHFSPNLNWRNIPIQEIMENLTSKSVIVENDVRAALIGEYYFGAGKGVKTFY